MDVAPTEEYLQNSKSYYHLYDGSVILLFNQCARRLQTIDSIWMAIIHLSPNSSAYSTSRIGSFYRSDN